MGIDWEKTSEPRVTRESVSYFKGSWGLNNEVLHMLGHDNSRGMNLWQATVLSIRNWLLREEDGNWQDQPFSHECAHILMALTIAALKEHPYIIANYPEIPQLLLDPKTQGDQQVETDYILALQFGVLDTLFGKNPENMDLSMTHSLDSQVDRLASVAKNPPPNIFGFYNDYTVPDYNKGAMKVFNVARMTGERIFDLRLRHNFDDGFVASHFAITRRKNGWRGNDNDISEPVEAGESFEVDGELQVFEPLKDPKDNPNIEIVFAAMIPGLQLIQREMIALKNRTPAKTIITAQMQGETVNSKDFFIEVRRNLNWALGLVPYRSPTLNAA